MAKATYLLRKAAELVKEKRYQDAVEVYLQATETDPSDARAWFALGVCLYKVDNLDVAHIALERARKMGYPRAGEALSRVEAAERRRSAEGKGAKATIGRAEAEKRAAQRPTALRERPPRPAVRPEPEKVKLDRYLRVMLIENIESDRRAVLQAIEGTIKDVDVSSVEYGVSTSQTMSSTVHYDAAVLDWDTAPDAATGLIRILKIKRPTLMVICLTEEWDPESAMEILEAGADYHLVKGPHFASAVPLVLAQWSRRDHAVAREQEAKLKEGQVTTWPDALNALGEPLVMVDADLTITQANQAAMKQFKRGEDEFLGRRYSTIFYDQEEPPGTCAVAQALEHGEPASSQFRQEALKKGFRVQAWPVFSHAGKVSSAIALLREDSGAMGASTMLRTREWLYRNLTEKANAGIALIGADGKLEYVNQGLCTMLDQTEQELLGQRIESLVPPQEQESLHECLEAAVEERQSGERITLQRADGATFPAETRMASFVTDEGTYLVLTMIGVSELERAEQELWTEARKFATVLDQGVDKLECGVVVLDAQDRVSWANGAAAELFARDKNAMVGSHYMTLVEQDLRGHLADAQGFVDALAAAHQKGDALEDYAVQLNAGAAETLSYWSTPVADGAPAVRRVEHFYRAAQRAAIPLPPGQEGWTDIVAAVPDMVFTADSEGRITWCNPAGPSLAGYGAGEFQSLPLANLAAAEARQQVQELVQKALGQAGRMQKQEVPMARGDGQRYWGELALVSALRQEATQAPVLHGMLRDITERKVAAAIRDILTGQRPV